MDFDADAQPPAVVGTPARNPVGDARFGKFAEKAGLHNLHAVQASAVAKELRDFGVVLQASCEAGPGAFVVGVEALEDAAIRHVHGHKPPCREPVVHRNHASPLARRRMEGDVADAERVEYFPLQKLGIGHPRLLLDDARNGVEGGVPRVCGALAGIEGQRLRCGVVEHPRNGAEGGVRGGGHQPRPDFGFGEDSIHVAEHLPDFQFAARLVVSDNPAVSDDGDVHFAELREMPADLVMEGKITFPDGDQRGKAGDRLGHGGEPEHGVRLQNLA